MAHAIGGDDVMMMLLFAIQGHDGAVTGISLHATGDYLLSSSVDQVSEYSKKVNSHQRISPSCYFVFYLSSFDGKLRASAEYALKGVSSSYKLHGASYQLACIQWLWLRPCTGGVITGTPLSSFQINY